MNYYNEHDQFVAAWLRELIADGQVPKGEVDERSVVDVQPGDLVGFTQCHFFAGIGGWSYALRLAEWPDNQPIWTGSCPCQPFSQAGKRRGLADERHLWPAWFRLIRECRPAILFGEQVEAAVRHGWLDGVFGDLEGEGYACGAAVLGAHSVGAPHIRQRLYWVADRCGAGLEGRQEQPTRQEYPPLKRGSDVGGVGQSNSARFLTGKRSSKATRYRSAVESTSCACGMGHTIGNGTQRTGRAECQSVPTSPVIGMGLSKSKQMGRTGQPRQDGAWSDLNLIPCADGTLRRVESGTFPLVARLSDTVVPSGDPSVSYVQATAEAKQMRLRGYGNAIVPHVAAAFIRAYMEGERLNGKGNSEQGVLEL